MKTVEGTCGEKLTKDEMSLIDLGRTLEINKTHSGFTCEGISREVYPEGRPTMDVSGPI